MDSPQFHLVLVQDFASPQGNNSPKRFFSQKFPGTLIDCFYFFDIEFSRHGDLQSKANALLERLLRSRDNQKLYGVSESVPLIFLGHGLASCLVMQALVTATEELRYNSIALDTLLVLFLEPPLNANNLVAWERELFTLMLGANESFRASLKLADVLAGDMDESNTRFSMVACNFTVVNIHVPKEYSGPESQIRRPPSSLDSADEKIIHLSSPHERMLRVFENDARVEEACTRIQMEVQNCMQADLESNIQTQREDAFTQVLTDHIASRTPLQTISRVLSLLDPSTHSLKLAASASRHRILIQGHQAFLDWERRKDVGVLHVLRSLEGGSTNVTSSIFGLLLSQPISNGRVVLSFSFNQAGERAKTAFNLYMSLCRQILSVQPHLFNHIAPVTSFLTETGILTTEVFWVLLRSLMVHALELEGCVYCLIDAIDQSASSPEDIIKRMTSFFQLNSGRFKLLLSGQDTPILNRSTDANCRQIRLDEENPNPSKSTLREHFRENMNHRAGGEAPWTDFGSKTLARLGDTNTSSSHLLAEMGMYIVGREAHRSNRTTLRRNLERLPETFEQAYDRIMDAIPKADRDWILSALRWIVHAIRPLKTTELAVAVALEEAEATEEDALPLRELVARDIQRDLWQCVGPLLKVVGNRFYLVHGSLRAYLIQHGHICPTQGPDTHLSLLRHCLSYVESMNSRISDQMNAQDGLDAVRELALLTYACTYWPDHYERATAKPAARAQVLKFLSSNTNVRAWANLYHQPRLPMSRELACLDSPLKIICNFGLVEVLDDFLIHIEDQPASMDDMTKSLDLAAWNGHAHVVRRLLDERIPSLSGLCLSAVAGFDDIVQCILATQPSLNDLDPTGYAPIHYAACGGDEKVVHLLVQHGADVGVTTSIMDTALHLASRTGHNTIIEALIASGANVHAENIDGYDALKYAAQCGFHELVATLLEHGADPERQGRLDGNTALHLAVQNGHSKATAALLRASQNIDAVNGEGMSPVNIAAFNGHLDVLTQLLHVKSSRESSSSNTHQEHGDLSTLADVFKLDTSHVKSALEWAATEGHPHIVDHLLNTKTLLHPEDCSSSLLFAATAGQAVVVRKLLDHLTLVAVDADGNTALHAAARCGHLQVLLQLVGSEIFRGHVDAKNENGMTALHVAVEAGYLEIVKALIDHGADAGIKTVEGDTVWHIATRHNHYQILLQLFHIQAASKLIDSQNDDSMSPLHIAADLGRVDMLDALLNQGAKAHIDSESNDTALHTAARKGHLAVAERLSSKMDTIWIKNSEGRTPLDESILAGHVEIAREFILKLRDALGVKTLINARKTLEIAAEHKYEELFILLLDLLSEDLDYNERNGDRDTIIHVAAAVNFVPGIKVLLDRALCDVNAKGRGDSTPLHTAAELGHQETVEVLLDRGADIEAENSDGLTPLYLASYDGWFEVVKTLVYSKPTPSLNAGDDEGWSPLHVAYDSASTTKVLLDAGADTSLLNKAGATPLSLACTHQCTETVKTLLEGQADPNLTGHGTPTPLHVASSVPGNIEIVKLLVKAGADTNFTDENGTSALHLAASVADESVTRFFIEQGLDGTVKSEEYGTVLTAYMFQSDFSPDLAGLLLRHGIHINAEGGRYHNALQAASVMGHPDAVAWLLDHEADTNAVGGEFGSAMYAIVDRIISEEDKGWVPKIIQLLLDKGADPNTIGSHGRRPVHAAAWHDRLEAIEMLAKNGANLRHKDEDDRTILMYAVTRGSSTVIDHLLATDDFDTSEHDTTGRTPLIMAVLANDVDTVDRLLKKTSVDAINVRDAEGKTALMHAVSGDNVEVTKKLLDSHADPTILGGRQHGALYWAARRGTLNVLELLIDALEHCEDAVDHFEMAIHGAVASRKRQSLGLLLQKDGIDPNREAPDGWTPLYTAQQYGISVIERALRTQLNDEPTSDLTLQVPSAWHPQDRITFLRLEPDEKSITVARYPQFLNQKERALARANYPMWPMINGAVYYFEVKIVKAPEDQIVGIGFCEDRVDLDRMVGWDDGSWGYHGADGHAFDERGYKRRFGSPYSEGDVIGCGVNFSKNIAFYTKNGEVIGRAFNNIKGKLYPAVSFSTAGDGAQIAAVFCNTTSNDFRFKGPYEGYETRRAPEMENMSDSVSDEDVISVESSVSDDDNEV